MKPIVTAMVELYNFHAHGYVDIIPNCSRSRIFGESIAHYDLA